MTLLLVMAALSPGAIAANTTTTPASPTSDSMFTVEQADQCIVVAAYQNLPAHVSTVGTNSEGGVYRDPDWTGPITVESVMDYRFRFDPTGADEDPYLRGQYKEDAPFLNDYDIQEPWSYSTYGLYNWSANGESHMFFYDGPEGISLVMRHDRLYDTVNTDSHSPYNPSRGGYTNTVGRNYLNIFDTPWCRNRSRTFVRQYKPSPGGGAATFQFENLPDGGWAYLDADRDRDAGPPERGPRSGQRVRQEGHRGRPRSPRERRRPPGRPELNHRGFLFSRPTIGGASVAERRGCRHQ